MCLSRYADDKGVSIVSWANVAGFFAGITIMYLTAFLVKF